MTHPLQALGDPVRRALVGHLAGGPRSVGELAERAEAEFGIGMSAVSQHLAVLKAARLARSEARGRARIYRLAPEGFADLQAWLDHYRPFWTAALDRLGEELDREGG